MEGQLHCSHPNSDSLPIISADPRHLVETVTISRHPIPLCFCQRREIYSFFAVYHSLVLPIPRPLAVTFRKLIDRHREFGHSGAIRFPECRMRPIATEEVPWNPATCGYFFSCRIPRSFERFVSPLFRYGILSRSDRPSHTRCRSRDGREMWRWVRKPGAIGLRQ